MHKILFGNSPHCRGLLCASWSCEPNSLRCWLGAPSLNNLHWHGLLDGCIWEGIALCNLTFFIGMGSYIDALAQDLTKMPFLSLGELLVRPHWRGHLDALSFSWGNKYAGHRIKKNPFSHKQRLEFDLASVEVKCKFENLSLKMLVLHQESKKRPPMQDPLDPAKQATLVWASLFLFFLLRKEPSLSMEAPLSLSLTHPIATSSLHFFNN